MDIQGYAIIRHGAQGTSAIGFERRAVLYGAFILAFGGVRWADFQA